MMIWIDQVIHAGGGYQQAVNAALSVKRLPRDLVEPVFFTNVEENLARLNEHGIEAEYLKISAPTRILLEGRRMVSTPWLLRLVTRFSPHNAFERALMKHRIDLAYFLSPSSLALHLEEINYIITVWDTCHRDWPEFPEVRKLRQFENRERLYKDALPRAVAVITDSKLGIDNIARRYGVDRERVHAVPFEAAVAVRKNAATTVDVRAKYSLNVPYVFYPAQFWAHKNHAYLLAGLKELEAQFGLQFGAIFTGHDKGNLEYIRKLTKQLQLDERVRFADFVSNEEIVQLYRQAFAVVMPTYFGPTNLPPLEAFELEVPLLYSDLPGLREQVGEAALLMDLNDPRSMANHIASLVSNPELKARLIASGKAVLRALPPDCAKRTLEQILRDYRVRRACWGSHA